MSKLSIFILFLVIILIVYLLVSYLSKNFSGGMDDKIYVVPLYDIDEYSGYFGSSSNISFINKLKSNGSFVFKNIKNIILENTNYAKNMIVIDNIILKQIPLDQKDNVKSIIQNRLKLVEELSKNNNVMFVYFVPKNKEEYELLSFKLPVLEEIKDIQVIEINKIDEINVDDIAEKIRTYFENIKLKYNAVIKQLTEGLTSLNEKIPEENDIRSLHNKDSKLRGILQKIFEKFSEQNKQKIIEIVNKLNKNKKFNIQYEDLSDKEKSYILVLAEMKSILESIKNTISNNKKLLSNSKTEENQNLSEYLMNNERISDLYKGIKNKLDKYIKTTVDINTKSKLNINIINLLQLIENDFINTVNTF